MGFLFASLGNGDASLFDPAAGFLNNTSAVFQYFPLPFNFVVQGQKHRPEAVHVFDFGAGAKLVAALGTDAHVGVAAEVAVLHICRGDAQVLQNGMQGHQIGARFLGRTHIRLADHFH